MTSPTYRPQLRPSTAASALRRAFTPGLIVTTVAVAAVYYPVARLSLLLAFPHTNVSPVWPPSGLAVAAAFVWGRRVAPGLALGAFLANLTTGLPVAVSLGIAAGNVTEYMLGAYLLRRYRFSPAIESIREALVLIILGAVVPPAVAATVGPLSLWLGGVVPADRIPMLWLTWWAGDGTGILVVTPAALLIRELWRRTGTVARPTWELAAQGAAVGLAAGFVFFSSVPAPFALFPLGLWAAFRSRQLGASAVALVVTVLSVAATVHGTGPFTGGDLDHRLLRVQYFNAAFAVTVVFLAASEKTRARAEKESTEAHASEEALRSRLRQVERLESLGQLSGGVAHDFNNLLTVMLTSAELAGEHLAAGDLPAARRGIDEIRSAAERGARLTGQLLAFARQDAAHIETVDLGKVVRGLRVILERTLGAQVAVAITSGPGTLTVSGDPSRLEQVLINLAVNARDAMPAGGTLSIETDTVRLGEEGDSTWPALPPGRYVRLVVSDTGTGMDAAVAEHAFDPFFTTKGPGKGTGLGLATVYGIITGAGGQIRVDSRVGKGTTFTALLPQHGPDGALVNGRTTSR